EQQHHGGAGGEHRLDEVVLGAGQLEALHVAALPGGAGAEQPGEVAHGEDGELGVLRGGDGLRDAGGVGVEEVGARDGGDLRGGEGGDVHRGAVVLEAGEDVVGEAVAAQEAARLHGGGADEGDRAGPVPVGRPRAQREQVGGVVQQDDRLLGHPAGEGAALGGVEVDRRAGGSRIELRVQQAQLDLLAQDAAHGGVDHVQRELAVLHGAGQVRVGGGLGQLDVQPGAERGDGGGAVVLHQAVHG